MDHGSNTGALFPDPPPVSWDEYLGRLKRFAREAGVPFRQSAKIDKLPPAPREDHIPESHRERTVFSSDRTHRFTLYRSFLGRGDPDRALVFLLMNPSGADSVSGDASIFKVLRWTWDSQIGKENNVGGVYVVNALSVRLTASQSLGSVGRTNYPENDYWIRRVAESAPAIIVGWGKPGHAAGRGRAIAEILRQAGALDRVYCFAKNSDGSPKHPLYVRNDASIEKFDLTF